jgi:molybdopterin converting factor small subunit
MEIRIQYFGQLADMAGQASEIWTLPEKFTVKELREKVNEKYPEIGMRKFKVAVNLQIAEDFVQVTPDSEIALLPPFAGG